MEDAVWQQNLFQLRFQILAKLSEVLGSGIIRDVEFRITHHPASTPAGAAAQ